MNKKTFRKVSDRLEDRDVEINLRGLGQFEIFKNVHVEPVLHVHNITESELSKIASHFHLKHEKIENNFVLTATANIDFKMKYINLFTAASAISKHNAATKFHLFENGGLESHLANDSKKEEIKHNKLHEKSDLNNQNETMNLSPRAAMTLTQIGLLNTTGLHNHHMNRDDLLSAFKKPEAIQQTTLKIVNGR